MAGYPNDPTAKAGSPETAFEAARNVKEAAQSIRARVLGVIAEARAHGANGFDVANALDLHVTQVRSRISELVAAKRVVDSRRRRMGEAGCNGVVWVLPEYGPPEPDDPQSELPMVA